MATKSANLYARIEPEVKEQAESILSTLGIPASNAINMFYKQIILNRGLVGSIQNAPYSQGNNDLHDKAEVEKADRARFEFVNGIVTEVEKRKEKGYGNKAL